MQNSFQSILYSSFRKCVLRQLSSGNWPSVMSQRASLIPLPRWWQHLQSGAPLRLKLYHLMLHFFLSSSVRWHFLKVFTLSVSCWEIFRRRSWFVSRCLLLSFNRWFSQVRLLFFPSIINQHSLDENKSVTDWFCGNIFFSLRLKKVRVFRCVASQHQSTRLLSS